MGKGGAPCPCWTLTTVRPLPPSLHSVHERAWYVCPLPPSFTAWALTVYVCEVLTLSLSLTQWFQASPKGPRTVCDFVLCCVRCDGAKKKRGLSGEALRTGLRTIVLTYLVL